MEKSFGAWIDNRELDLNNLQIVLSQSQTAVIKGDAQYSSVFITPWL